LLSVTQDRDPHATALVPRLGLYTATMIVIGSMIGSGIFKKPAVMAAELGSPGLLLATWVIAGVVTLFGALSNAEIASMITAVGGQYAFFRRIYNDFVGYLYGWSVFAVIQTGSIASIAYVFAEYTNYFVPLPRLPAAYDQLSVSLFGILEITPLASIGVKLLTVACILLLTGANIIGVVVGGAVQNVVTTLKLLAITALIVLPFGFGAGTFAHLAPGAGAAAAPATAAGTWGLVAAMGLAISGAFWAYDGWNNITYVAGEVREPQRNIPRALILGTACVMAVYVLTNVAYLYALPIGDMAQSKLVAADAMRRTLGAAGAAFVALLVIVSTFGTANGTTLASARVYFAMARDRMFFTSLGRVHPRFGTPARSLAVQGLWASLLVFSGTFDQLTDMLIFVSWIFYLLGAFGVFVLRRREPDTPRPYRVWGYPVVPAVFVLFAAGYVVVTLIENLRNALLGLLLVAIGLLPYLYWRRRRATAGDGAAAGS
jgi:APA family basic amino acid/polyamine antiporter